jgi:hypothetical protein
MASDPAIAFSLDLQRHGWRVVVQQDSQPGQQTEVTVYLRKANRPLSEQVVASGSTFAAAIRKAAQLAGVEFS